MKINFQVDGGIGKSVLATAVCNARKRQPHTIAAQKGATMAKGLAWKGFSSHGI
jgi:hypothetical protein